MSRLQHFQKFQFRYEMAFIAIFFFINSNILATSVIMERSRDGELSSLKIWMPFVWEYSSAISLILLIPAINWLLEKYPFNWQKIKRSLLIYLACSILFSLCHVAIMVAIRKVVYWTQSLSYQFGDVFFELFYEYRKDLWTFLFIIGVIKSYQYIQSQLQGEASLVSDGEIEGEMNKEKPPNIDRLLVKKLGKEFIIKVSDIEWLESSGNYVNLYVKGRIYPTRATLTNLIEQISDKGFCRIHRSYAVNLDQIDSITPLSSGDSEVKLTNGKELNLSRRYKDELKQRLS